MRSIPLMCDHTVYPFVRPWCVSSCVLTPHTLPTTAKVEKPSCLFETLEFFVSRLALHGLEEVAKCFEGTSELVHSPREMADYSRVKCDLIMDFLKFVSILVDHHQDNPSSVCVHDNDIM